MNNKYKYKAYISYSHRDERWAKWLHRALESYRIPRKLVGTTTARGEVSARIRPVFRDRDDLSSASDLGGTVKQALADSENMIVICSPDSVASFWVNEEIREFAKLGRQKQMFCIIVDGDPPGVDTPSTCFPAALAEIGLKEPLAADVRKWADGKHLSKLKVVSGMLGLPLDQLRRRDLQKRQKVWLMTGVACVALVAVLLTAVTARIAAQQRRDSGESLVGYKLNELRTMLNVSEDPENLGRMVNWDSQERTRLIAAGGSDGPELTASALVMRDEGLAFRESGDLTRAQQHFQHSWLLLAEVYRRDRGNHLAFFELGQAEFWIGQTYLESGDLPSAEKAFMSYTEITRRLIVLQPENAEWVLEMAFALTNLGSLQRLRDVNNPDRTLQFMQSSLEYNQIALVLDPANDYYRSELGQSHANLADAQLQVCDLDGALKSRQQQFALDSELLNAEPEDTGRVQRMVYAITGLATVENFYGEIDSAMNRLEDSLELMEKANFENGQGREETIEVLVRRIFLSRLKAMNGNIDEAWEDSNQISEIWLTLESISQEDMRTSLIYIDSLIERASLLTIRGDTQQASQLLFDIQLHLAASQDNMAFKRGAGNRLVDAAFRYWETTGELPPADIISQLPEYIVGSGRARSCTDADRAVLKSLMLGQPVQARAFTDYLLAKGYRETSFIRVCEQYSLCSGQ